MSESIVSDELEKSITLEKRPPEGSSSARCGIDISEDYTEYFEVLEYRREMPNGGQRVLELDEKGNISLKGSDPVLDYLEKNNLPYTTELEKIDDLRNFDELKAFDDSEELSNKLDSIIYTLECRSDYGI